MGNGDECSSDVALAGTVEVLGGLYVEGPHGGTRSIEGELSSSGLLSLAAGQTLGVSGSYVQRAAGRLKTYMAGASDYGAMSVGGGIVLGGTLVTHQVSPFTGSLGQSFTILDGGLWLAGAFSAQAGTQIGYFPALYYKPGYSTHYAPTLVHRVTVDVTKASVVLSPMSGPPSSSVEVASSAYHEYLPGDTLTPTFTDHAGHTTVLPSITVPESGTFATTITIPAAAALGAGTLTVSSTQTGVKVLRTLYRHLRKMATGSGRPTRAGGRNAAGRAAPLDG